jgi:hypothetical protein
MLKNTLSVKDTANGPGESPGGQEHADNTGDNPQPKFLGDDTRMDSREVYGEPPSAAVTEEDRMVLLELGATPEKIREYETNAARAAAQAPRGAVVTKEMVIEHRDVVKKRNGGSGIGCAGEVNAVLKQLKLVPEDFPSNTVGDVLGKGHNGNGLNAPSVKLNGKTFYDYCFQGDDAAKVARIAWLKANKEKLRAILVRK